VIKDKVKSDGLGFYKIWDMKLKCFNVEIIVKLFKGNLPSDDPLDFWWMLLSVSVGPVN
jgi:hypothetical protein